MTIAFNEMHEVHLGYAAIFICICFGFLFLKKIYRNECGPGFWATSFACNSIGFILWSGILSIKPSYYYLAGEIFHILGFFFLIYGALKFVHTQNIKMWGIVFLILWILVWVGSVLLVNTVPLFAGISLKLLRAALFMTGGIFLLVKKDENEPVGKNIASGSLIIWALYVSLSIFIKINNNLFFGFLIGFQVLSAFGMVAMVIDRIRVESERKAHEKVGGDFAYLFLLQKNQRRTE